MTPTELFDFFRIEVDDVKDPFLWADAEIDNYMDKAQRAFARATDCFLDSTTAVVTQIPILTTTAVVAFHPAVIRPRRAELLSTKQPVVLATTAEMDLGAITGRDYGLRVPYRWRTATGTPQFAITDFNPGKLLLTPIPVVTDTLSLVVYRFPLAILNSASAAFEILDEDHQYGLISYMQYLAYRKQDADTYNPKRSAAAKKEWEEFIVDARRSFNRRRFSHRPVSYGGV